MKSTLRRRSLLALALIALLLIAAACGADNDEPAEAVEPLRLVLGGGQTGSGALQGAGTLAEFVNTRSGLDSVRITVSPTAFLENMRALEAGDLDLGLVTAPLLDDALHSRGAFTGEDGYQNVVGVLPVFVSWSQIVTYDESIESVYDLEGKRINMGAPGTAGAEWGERVLEAAGLIDGVQLEYEGLDEGVRLLQDGLVDALSVLGPAPNPSIVNAAAARHIYMPEIPDEVLAAFAEQHGTAIALHTPADVYGEGQPPRDLQSIGYIAYLVAHRDVPSDVIEDVARALLTDEGQAYLVDGFHGFELGFEQLPGLSTLEAIGAEVHQGVVQYWDAEGVEVPASIRP